MTVSNRVDVVTYGTHTGESVATLSLPTGPTETVDVAPNAAVRIVVVARTKAAGAALAEDRKLTPVAIVTPRSPDAARSLTADEIIWADDLTHEERAALEPVVLPSLATPAADGKPGE
jgi:hypothetical protein